jgi:hypothetical protein
MSLVDSAAPRMRRSDNWMISPRTQLDFGWSPTCRSALHTTSRVSLFATSEITGSTALTYGTRHAVRKLYYYLSSTT